MVSLHPRRRSARLILRQRWGLSAPPSPRPSAAAPRPAPDPPPEMGPFGIDVATDIRGCAATVALQDAIWSGDVIVPPQLMLAAAHNGGFVAVGYAEGDPEPAGFVFGFLGIRDY